MVLHVLPDPQAFAALYRLTFGDFRTPPLQTGNPFVWIGSIWETLIGLGIPLGAPFRAQSVLGILIAAGTIGLLWRRSRADKTVLTLLGGLILAFALLTQLKQLFYYISLLPAAVLAVAAWLTWMARLPWRGSLLAYGRTVVLGGLILGAAGIILPTLQRDGNPIYETSLTRIRQVIPAGSTVMGNQLYWFAQPSQRYLSWEQLIFYQRYRPGSSLAEAFAYLRPDYLLIDGSMRFFIRQDKAHSDRYAEIFYISEVELTDFLADHGRLIDTVQPTETGTIQIYQLNWK